LLARGRRDDLASEARLWLLDDFEARFEAVDELGSEVHRVARTTCPLAETMAELEAILPLWPEA
jgi:hypothetical protein